MEELAEGITYQKDPTNGEFTGCYMTNEDGSVKVACVIRNSDPVVLQQLKDATNNYKWDDGDFLLASYPKNGTHFMWEIMMMLVRGSADYIQDSKAVCMIDLYPVTESARIVPSPRVLNTHYRFDVLPKQYRGKKTVVVVRNPKDAAVSYFHHKKNRTVSISTPEQLDYVQGLTFQDHLRAYLFDKDASYGTFFDYMEYMWSLKDEPNILILHFEDIKRDPVSVILQVNEFMGTNRSLELVQQIADATNFIKMKDGKLESSKRIHKQLHDVFQAKDGKHSDEPAKQLAQEGGQPPTLHSIYRKGEIGDWKNQFTVADNELFESFLDKWPIGKEISFRY